LKIDKGMNETMTNDERNELRSELGKETVRQLLEIAKSNGIVGRHAMRKQQLIDALVDDEEKRHVESRLSESRIDDAPHHSIDRTVKESVYLCSAKEGTVVAFKKKNTDRVASAKIVSNCVEKQTLQVQTSRGKYFSVPYNDVLWVKTGTRWPRGVFELLRR
jgi:hypothetical protein